MASLLEYFLGSTSAAEVGDSADVAEVEVTIPERTTLGLKIILVKGKRPAVAVIALPRNAETGEPGPVEKSGLVKLGDELVAVSEPACQTSDPS